VLTKEKVIEKLQYLARVSDYPSIPEMIEETKNSTLVPSVCINSYCFSTDMLPAGCTEGYCDECEENSIKSCTSLFDQI
jgi:hypothetical protein